jgi:hypothetical protein
VEEVLRDSIRTAETSIEVYIFHGAPLECLLIHLLRGPSRALAPCCSESWLIATGISRSNSWRAYESDFEIEQVRPILGDDPAEGQPVLEAAAPVSAKNKKKKKNQTCVSVRVHV